MRLFVSIDLAEELVGAVESVQADLSNIPSLTLVEPSQAHLTLKFIGDTDPDRVSAIEAALSDSISSTAPDPFQMEIAGIGAFPSTEFIRVIWLGVKTGTDETTALHEAIESNLTEIGVDPESHEFTPHITIARMGDARGKAKVQELLESSNPQIGTMDVTQIQLTESTLTETGPEYSTVQSFPLAD